MTLVLALTFAAALAAEPAAATATAPLAPAGSGAPERSPDAPASARGRSVPAPSIRIALAPPAARPGDAVLVRVLGAPGEPLPAGTLGGRPLSFWRARGEWRALAPLPIEAAPGPLPVEVDAGGARATAPLEIVDPNFPSRSLTVDDRFVEPPAAVKKRIAADRAAFAKAYARPFAPPLFARRFEWPREARLTGRFGDKRVFNGKRESIHYGTDVTGPVGSPIGSAADGVVVLTRDAYMSGKTVLVWHGADAYTAYFHLARIDVRPGAKVRRGQRIGRLGASGRVTGPHLHWSARVGGLFVDPESLLGIDFTAGSAPPRTPRPGARVPEGPAEGPDAPPAPGEAAAGAPAAAVSPAGAAPAPPR
jgi:hypothetical protein